MTLKEIEKACEALRAYKGNNDHILYLQRQCAQYSRSLTEFDVKYIKKNRDFVPFYPNKTVKISDLLGEELKSKYNLDFVPKKLRITKVIGMMNNSLHCYAQFRQSVPPGLMYISKKYILDPLVDINYDDIAVNFDEFDQKTEKFGRKLKEHQKTGVKFLLGNKKCILADSMGMGKGCTSVVAAIASKSEKILVICPATMKTTWFDEISYYEDTDNIQIIKGSKWTESKKFTIINYEVLKNFYKVPTELVYETQTVTDARGNQVEIDVPIYVNSKSGKKRVQKEKKSTKKAVIAECMENSKIMTEKFDCVIIDEAQKLSNDTSERYKIVEDFLKRNNSDYVFLLTGTPLTNNPKNLYSVLKVLGAEITEDYPYYVKRYCDGREIKLASGKRIMLMNGATNLDELKERIKHLYIRRLISDVPEMVGKTISSRTYELSDKQTEEYNKLWDEYVESQTDRTKEDTEEYRQLVEGGLVRHYLALEMVPNTIQLAEEIIDYDEKVIVVCTFQDEVDRFKTHFKDKCVVYDGRVISDKKKDKAVKEFMNNPDIKVFVANLNAASVGITLTSANKLIFNSYSWEEINNRQMQDRIWRLTQTKDVECIYQLWNDSISTDMWEKVLKKGLIMDTVIKTETEK